MQPGYIQVMIECLCLSLSVSICFFVFVFFFLYKPHLWNLLKCGTYMNSNCRNCYLACQAFMNCQSLFFFFKKTKKQTIVCCLHVLPNSNIPLTSFQPSTYIWGKISLHISSCFLVFSHRYRGHSVLCLNPYDIPHLAAEVHFHMWQNTVIKLSVTKH